jgi:Flp pilus assembly pilin Flp
MSTLHSAQDRFRRQCIEAFVALQALAERAREQRGQTAAEYMGILFIVAAIIVAIVGAHLEKTIADRLGKIVTAIGNGVTP